MPQLHDVTSSCSGEDLAFLRSHASELHLPPVMAAYAIPLSKGPDETEEAFKARLKDKVETRECHSVMQGMHGRPWWLMTTQGVRTGPESLPQAGAHEA